jgi:hypothetical protein
MDGIRPSMPWMPWQMNLTETAMRMRPAMMRMRQKKMITEKLRKGPSMGEKE